MKLSKAQTIVMKQATDQIDYARTHSLDEWHVRWFDCHSDEKSYKELYNGDYEGHIKWCQERYEGEKNGIVTTMCNSRTLAKLQEKGLIEILHDSKGDHYGVDKIKVLNY